MGSGGTYAACTRVWPCAILTSLGTPPLLPHRAGAARREQGGAQRPSRKLRVVPSPSLARSADFAMDAANADAARELLSRARIAHAQGKDGDAVRLIDKSLRLSDSDAGRKLKGEITARPNSSNNMSMDGVRTSISGFSAIACVSMGAYGSYTNSSVAPFLVAALFSGLYFYARRRVSQGDATSMTQLILIFSLIASSFVLHLVYTPAGLCCFFTLMLCKNEVLMPPRRDAAKQD